MAEAEIYSISDTLTNLLNNLEPRMRGIADTAQGEEWWVWKETTGNRSYVGAAQKYWDGDSWVKCDAEFKDVEADSVVVAGSVIGSNLNIDNWDTAHSWGNHASAGYLSVESDPVFSASPAADITNTKINNWDEAYGWGNHAIAGYLTSVPTATSSVLGLVKLFSGTVQSVAAASVSANASRTYGIQVNSSGQMVVNVPWVDTNTTYSEISEAESDSTSSSTTRLVTGRRLNSWWSRKLAGNLAVTGNVTGANLAISNWNTAYTNTHTHSNKANLDTVNQDLGTSNNVSFARLTSTGQIGWGTSYMYMGQGWNSLGMPTDTYKMVFQLPDANTGWVWSNVGTVGPAMLLTRGGVLGIDTIRVGFNSGYDLTTSRMANWDAAYSWGDHAAAGYTTGNQTITLTGDASGSGTTSITVTVADDSHTHDTRYFTEAEINSFFSGSTGKTGYNKTNWDTAYSQRHTHSNLNVIEFITSADTTNWDTAYSNNHSHLNSSRLANINQELSTYSSPTFDGGITLGTETERTEIGGSIKIISITGSTDGTKAITIPDPGTDYIWVPFVQLYTGTDFILAPRQVDASNYIGVTVASTGTTLRINHAGAYNSKTVYALLIKYNYQ